MKAREERYMFLQSQYYKLLGFALDRETTTKEVLECHQNFVDYEATCTKEDLEHADKVLADTDFKVGDRVEHRLWGKGVVVFVNRSIERPLAVQFDTPDQTHGKEDELHDLGNNGAPLLKTNSGWWCLYNELRRIENE